MRLWLRRLWKALSVYTTLAPLGVGAVALSLGRAVSDLSWPWLLLLGVGAGLVTAAFLQYRGLLKLDPRLPAPARLKHSPRCPTAMVKVKWGTRKDGSKDRITYCTNCQGSIRDKPQARRRELGLPEWEVGHGPEDIFNSAKLGVVLTIGSLTEKEKIIRCEVHGPYAEPAVADFLSNAFRPRAENLELLSPDDKEIAFYPSPDMFKDAPEVPLKNGEYRVEWWASRNNVGEFLLKEDRFFFVNGTLVR